MTDLKPCRDAFEARFSCYPAPAQEMLWQAWQAAWNERVNNIEGRSIHIQFSENGLAIRKWALLPFEGSAEFVEKPAEK